MKKLIWWSCEMPTCNFTKKNSFTHPPYCISPSFSQNTSWLLLPKRLWKCESTISFWKYKQKVVLLVIYLFNYDSSKSAFFVINYGIWRSIEYSFYEEEIGIIRVFLLCVLICTFLSKSNCSSSWWFSFPILTSVSNSHFKQ